MVCRELEMEKSLWTYMLPMECMQDMTSWVANTGPTSAMEYFESGGWQGYSNIAIKSKNHKRK